MSGRFNRRYMIRDASFFSGSTYIAQAMFFIRGFINAKILGPALYGLWSALNIVLKYSSYMHLGSLNAMNREIPYYSGRDSIENMDKARNASFTFYLFANFTFAFLLIIISLALWHRLSLEEAVGLIAVALIAFSYSVYEFCRIALTATKRFVLVSKVNIIFSILSLALTLALVPLFKIYAVYGIALVTTVISLIYIWLRQFNRPRLDFDFKEMARLIKIGFPIMSINFLHDSIVSIASIAVLILLGRKSLGYYSVAMLAAAFLTYFSNSVHAAFEPRMYERYGETHDVAQLKNYLFKPVLIMALLFPVMLVFYYIGASFFLRHFLPNYIASISIFPFVLIATFFLALYPIPVYFAVTINKQRAIIPVSLASIAVLGIYSLIFINMGFGITAVALGFLLSVFFGASVTLIYATNHYMKTPLNSLLYLGKLCLPLLYMCTLLYVTELLIPNSPDIFSDLLRSIIKGGILLFFSLPLIYIEHKKTGVLSDVLNFLRSDRLISKTRLSDGRLRLAILGPYPIEGGLNKIYGGVQAVVVNMIEGLARFDDLDIHVVTVSHDIDRGMDFVSKGVNIHVVQGDKQFGNLTFYLRTRKRLCEKLRQINPDLIHTHGLGYYTLAALDSGHGKVVVSTHGLSRRNNGTPQGIIEQIRIKLEERAFYRCAKKAQNIIVNNPYTRTHLSKFGNKNIYELNNPVSETYFGIESAEEEQRILFTGNICAAKGVMTILESLRELEKSFDRVEVRFAGPFINQAFHSKIARFIREHRLEKRVHFLGWLDEEALKEEYRKASIFVFPSQYDISPLALLQAMAAGKAIVTTRVGGIPYIIDDGVSGLLIEKGDSNALADRIRQLIKDVRLRRKIGINARSKVSEAYRITTITNELYRIYKEVYDNGSD